ncbi:GAF domain-containing protein [Zavarzinia compransoris]|uniref:GAF domain-containing protein n=1 Tax=Zavarzinia marina TaxID=2911065 RepID=UPI001F181E77|nr:GAF domain-containing protein [Zavarzinia marina]MCF4167048.1 GAF domain-containing protein [Zavarzinia marina]
MESPRLRDLAACFEGVIPSIIATVDADGMPNISYLSHVHFVDDDHVALSNQYFAKTAANVRSRGTATVLVVDGRSGAQFLLDLAFVRSFAEGDLFDRMSDHLDAMSAQQGMSGMMALRGADLYRVRHCEAVPALNPPEAEPVHEGPDAAGRLSAAARLALAIGAQGDADTAIDLALDGIAEGMGFRHLMVLIPDPGGRRLSVLTSRGYETLGIGSEVTMGDGVIGIAAARRRPLRLSDLSRGRRYAAAVKEGTAIPGAGVPYPGLDAPLSQIAIPMISRGQLVGVLFAEAPLRFAFTREDEDALVLIAGQLAACIALDELAAPDAPAPAPPPAEAGAGPRIRVRYFPFDDSIFIDDDYLIRGVAGRLLHHFLRAHLATGQRDFTNREIRLAPDLRLPDVKDNLETRLILLRRRLDERNAPIRLQRPERGRLRLDLTGRPEIEVVT